MRVFNALCRDDKTGYRMVLSECSYNEACAWLYEEGKKSHYEVDRVEVDFNGLTHIWMVKTELEFDADINSARPITGATIKFYYDEERGYLLGE